MANQLSLVFLPPGGGDVSGWGPHLDHFKKKYDILAIDMPGAGSKASEKHLGSIQECAAYVEGVLWGRGVQKPVLLGYSMGGLIGQCLAVRKPDAYRGLVLVATAARIKIQQEVLDNLRKDPAAARRMIDQTAGNPNRPAQGGGDRAFNAEALHAYLNATNAYDAREQIAGITTPTLIAHGDVDMVCPLRFGEFVHQSIAGSQFKLFKGASHGLPREFPKELQSAIEGFLAGLA